MDGKQAIELRFLRIGGQGEVFINNRRVLYVPIDPNHVDLVFSIKLVGMTAKVEEIHISELFPKQ